MPCRGKREQLGLEDVAVRDDYTDVRRERAEALDECRIAGPVGLQHRHVFRLGRVFTGGGTAVERDRPWGLSGCVTTATTSNPSPSRASSEGTANSGVPKKTTRTQSSPAGSGVTSFRYPVCPLRDFFHLARSSPRFTR